MTREFKRLQMPQASPFSQVDDKFALAMSAPGTQETPRVIATCICS